ncbi:MAG: HpsJ family protein [Phormidium sp. BM_Day4_Bin.17]|nr:HpsJ family protein [Phormidium sp. BM_Day4_Bin.17]UCJ12609.1 MAG: HpsJ family protein [Phormidium sp. PBR-2020]
MKSKESKTSLALASRGLKLAGTVLILITLLNFILLIVPPDAGNPSWWLNLSTQIIQQGIIPLIGVAALLAGIACEVVSGAATENDTWIQTTKTRTFRLSLVLGLIFLILIPGHALAALVSSQQAIARIDREASESLEQIELQLQQQQQLYLGIIEGGEDTEALLGDLIGDEPLNEEQLAQFQEFIENPDSIDRQIQTLRTSLVERVQARSSRAKERSRFGAWKSIARFGLTSIMLSTCYLNIAFLGRGMGKRTKVKKVKRRPATPPTPPKPKTKRIGPPPSDDPPFMP